MTESKLAGATQLGSAEAYSQIAAAFQRQKDPAVAATKDQTKQLAKPLNQMAAALTGGLGGVLLISSMEG
jgi:hypothetical protein